MEKLKAAVLQRLSNATPNKPLPPSLIDVIERRLAVSFPDFKTPIHLTYASMIQQAIKDLNEEDGSSEQAISDYILENFEGLPWAHNSYLRHYLRVLCENEEIVYFKGCYTTSDLLHRPKSRRRLLRRKPGRKRKECEIDGNIGVEENEVCLEDEENLTFRNIGTKRSRRRSLVLMDDNDDGDDDNGATEVVRKEENKVGDRNEVGDLTCGDEIDGNSKLEECNAGNDDKGGEPKEVNTETQLPLVASGLEKILPAECECECEGELRTETLQFDHENSSANLMLVPIEGVKESNNTPIEGKSTQVSGLNVDVDATNFNDKLEKLVCGKCICAADMAIVLFEGDSSEFAEKKEIVCCLPCDLRKEPKKVHRPKRRPKHSQEGVPSSFEESMPASSVSPVGPKSYELGELCKVPPQQSEKTEVTSALLESSNLKDLPLQSQQAYMSCPRLPTLLISVEKGSIETKFEKQKLHSESSPSCHRMEIMSPVDDDFNVPLQQVLSNHSKHRKLSSENSTGESPLASSLMSGQRLQAVLPDPENPLEMIRPRGEEVTCIRRNQKQGQKLQHPKRQLRPWIQKRYDLVEDGVVAPESDALLSSDRKEGSYDGKEDQNPHDITSQQRAMEHQHQQGECQDQGSSPHIEPMAETVYLDNQHNDLGEIQPKMVEHGLHKTCEVDLRDPSPGQKNNGQQQGEKQQHQSELAEVVWFDSEPVTNVATDTELVLDNEQFQCMEKQTDKPQQTTKVDLRETLSTQNEKGKQKDQEQQRQGKTAEVGCSGSELVVPIATMEDKVLSESVPQKPEQLKCELGIRDSGSTLPKQPEKKRRGRPPKNSSTSLDSLQHQQDKLSELVPQKRSQKQKKCGKKDGHKLQRKQEEVTKEDVAIEENLLDLPQSEPYKTTPCELTKKRALGTPRKSKEAAPEDSAPLNMHDQQQQEQHEPAGHQLMKKDDQKTPRKRKRAVKVVGDPLSVLDQQQEGAAEMATYQLEKKDGRGRRMKEKKTTAGDVAAQPSWSDEQQKESAVPSLHAEQQDGPSPRVLYQLRRKDVLGSLRKEAPTTKNDGALDSVRDGPEGGPSPPNSHDQQEEGPNSSKLHGRSEKGSTPQIVHGQPEKGPTDPETKQVKKKRGRGRPKKKEASTVAGMSISHDQQQEGQAPQKLHDQQEGLTPPVSHGPTPKNLRDQLEEGPTPRNTPDQLEEGKHEPVTNQQKKKAGRGSSRNIKATIEDVTGAPNSDNQQEEGITPPSVLDQPKKRAGRGVARKKKATTKDSADVQDSHNQQQEEMNYPNVPVQLEVGPNEQATNQQKRKFRRGMPKKIEATTEDVVGLPKLPDQKEERLTPPNLPDQHVDRATSAILHDKLEEGLPAPKTSQMEQEKGQGIPGNQKEATTEDEARLPKLPEHQQDELARTNILSHDETPQQLAQEEHSQDQLPKSELVAAPLGNQPPKQQEEQCKEMVTKQKSAKTKPIEVPLSSKDQLRSRMKRPYQAGT